MCIYGVVCVYVVSDVWVGGCVCVLCMCVWYIGFCLFFKEKLWSWLGSEVGRGWAAGEEEKKDQNILYKKSFFQ